MSRSIDIAIVGIGAVFPDAPDLEAFWANVVNGRSAAREVPKGRWTLPTDQACSPGAPTPDRVYSNRACLIDSEPHVDATDLDLPADVLRELDPSVRLLLAAGMSAFQDSTGAGAEPARTGVILGNLALPTETSSAITREWLGQTFEERVLGQNAARKPRPVHPLNRYVTGLPAGVLAKALRLGGGSFTLDAACASSLYALKLAADELRSGRMDAVLAGGLSRPDSLYTQMGFSQLRALSPTGMCSPFDAKGNGLVVGEGAGIVLLKRLDDAAAAGDRIYGVIKGIGLSNDIGGSLLAPSSEGQLRAMRAAYRESGWAPHDVDHIECHATGTPLGDAVEVESLRTLWGAEDWRPGQCVIGSAKSNFGHTLTAAGSIALIKTLLAMREGTLPPTANYERPAPNVALDGSPFEVLSRPRAWTRRTKETPRRAAVSAFGFGGINAHVLIEEWMEPVTATRPVEIASQEPPAAVAIVGMAAHFGPWSSLRAFQERVLGAGDNHGPMEPDNWWGIEDSGWFRAMGVNEETFKGYFIPEVSVALDRFRIPPRELEEMLPQQLLMLQVAAAALDDAGVEHMDQNRAGNPNAGTFIGLGLDLNTTNFSFRWSLQNAARDWAEKLGLKLSEEELSDWTESMRNAAGPALNANRTMGALASIVASRIAREFKFGGPGFTVSSEESSGMRAIETAVRALQTGALDQALVGAIDLAGDARAVLATHARRPYSTSATARPFDEAADGAVIGEGAAAVLLKRLEDAERDGDRIYAVIRGIGSASGGGVDRHIPDEHAYVCALERAYADAHVAPDSVTYVETHGSGHADEDHMEIRALARVFKRPDGGIASNHVSNQCLLGSAKADVGHAGAASGLAGLVKTALCLYHEILPPVRNFERGRAELMSTGHRLRVAQRPQYWFRDRARGPRMAGVSAFSVDGNCSHVVLQGYDHDIDHAVHVERLQPLGTRGEGLFAVEANNADALAVGIGRLQAHIEHAGGDAIEKVARDWWRENREDSSKPLGVTFVARSGEELLRQIEFMQRWLSERPNERLSGKETGIVPPHVRDRVFYNPEPLAASGDLAFVYPGSGNQYAHMGRDLLLQWPEIPRRQDAENEFLFSQYQPDIFWNSETTAQINDNHKAALFGQVALGTATTDLMRSLGLRPAAVVGYSLGETAGLVAMKAWRDRDLMLKRINESTLFTQDLAGEYRAARKAWQLPSNKTVDWALGVIDRPAKVVRAALQDHKKVYTLIVNTLHECVVGGDLHAVEKLVKKLDCEFFPLHGVTTVHCEVAKEVQEPYRELHLLPTAPPKGVRFYSGAWGTAYNVSKDSAADSVLAQAIYGIDYPKVIESAYEDGARLFLEMGPGASCSRMIGEILGDRPHVARSLCFQGQEATTSVLRALAQLIAERVPVDLSVLYGQETTVLAHRIQPHDEPLVRVAAGGKPFEVVLPKKSGPPAVGPAPVTPKPAPAGREPVAVQAERSLAPPAAAFDASDGRDPLIAQWAAMTQAQADAHAAYLRASSATVEAMATAIRMQLETLGNSAAALPQVASFPDTVSPPAPAEPAPEPRRPLALTREQCLEYARGSIAKSLGDAWSEIDNHPTRVRLPDEPLMLVDRILSFEGEARSLTSGRVITEHDVLPGAWYLDCNRVPTCVAVEAGQADLILAAYLGIDFITKGRAMYRLLDAVVTFHGPLPQPGDTIRYDIRIERFFRQGETHLMRFNFDATVNGRPLITMRDGCAGYFTREELDAGAGIIKTKLDRQPVPGKRPADWVDLVSIQRTSYSNDQVNALRAGDLAGCFGSAFANLDLANPVGLPGGQMKLVDRILDLDPQGGRFGLGKISGEMDIHPDDWFLTCHFVDDMVMPGTLMYECCLHTLRVHLLRMGWVGEANQVVYEPVQGVASRLKCRGEVNETTDKVVYEVEIKELGYNPAPYAIADCLMYVDGKPAIEMLDMSVQLTGLTREGLETMWRDAATAPLGPRPAVYDNASIMAFAEGNPSQAFGEPYKVFDRERFIARLPRPPYKFLDRIVSTDAEPWVMRAGGVIEAEYDVPPDEWYFASNRQPTMPFAVLLEIALQPCGWFSAYMGSPLTSDKDLHYRNLGGTAVQHMPVTPDMGTLATRVRCTGVSSSGGMIIQNFRFDMTSNGRPVYSGDTNFGYFSKVALANQIGIRDAQLYHPTDKEVSVNTEFPYPRRAPYPDDTLRMVDRVDVFDPSGGPNGLGFIRAYIDVDPSLWFFRAHFYQDPVWPGSLGLEAMLQLMKYVAAERWGVGGAPRFEAVAVGEPHKWIYRGQVIPGDERVTVQAVVTERDDTRQLVRADGFLAVDGRVIYQMQDFTVRYTEQP